MNNNLINDYETYLINDYETYQKIKQEVIKSLVIEQWIAQISGIYDSMLFDNVEAVALANGIDLTELAQDIIDYK